jgi:hypothetical protein
MATPSLTAVQVFGLVSPGSDQPRSAGCPQPGHRLQGGDATVASLVQAWLRAEHVRELVVLRAHHLAGAALSWLLSLPG